MADTTKPHGDALTPNSRDPSNEQRGKDNNPDPITGAPGSHPVGTGIGATGGGLAGAAAGAAIGSVVPGIGTVVGGVVGAVAGAVGGGYAGKGMAEVIDPTAEREYWRQNYRNQSYVQSTDQFEDLEPAYRHGWESRSRYHGHTFDEVEPEMRSDWERSGRSMSWERAKNAVRDAWEHVEDKFRTEHTNPDQPSSSQSPGSSGGGSERC